VLDIEDAIDRSWIGQSGDLVQPRQDDLYYELTTSSGCMNMRAIIVMPDENNTLRITTTQDETFVFEVITEDEYGLIANGRSGEWYTEIEEQLLTKKRWLLLRHPVLLPEQVRIPLQDECGSLDVVEHLSDLIAALERTKIDMEK
jgi:hypothetical protein